MRTSCPESLQDAQTGSQPSHFDFLPMGTQCWWHAAITVWRTSSYSDCRHGEHSYHASSGSGLERTKLEDAFVIGREKQTLYILEADIGGRERLIVKRLGSKKAPNPPVLIKQGLPWPVAHPTRKRPVTGKLPRQQCHYCNEVYLINHAMRMMGEVVPKFSGPFSIHHDLLL